MDNWELYYRTHKDKGSNAITGVPPLTFVSNGENLADYRIYGASGGMGDKTKNLWSEDYTNINQTSGEVRAFVSIYVGEGFFTLSTTTPKDVGYADLFLISGTSEEYVTSGVAGVWVGQSRTVESINGYVTISYRKMGINPENYRTILNAGINPEPYEPYGYKIPIVCGGTTTNIYLDEPLTEGESISMSDTGISIPTINGTNILMVDTEAQPSKMYIKYGDGSVSQSLMKYLEYKYKFAKE